jgi:hypothetical protein
VNRENVVEMEVNENDEISESFETGDIREIGD